MKKSIYLLGALLFTAMISKAQTTAMDFNRNDCNGANHHLNADLDAGNAVVLFFFMPNCSMCPPPASKIQTMVNNVLKKYPGKVKGYAMPFNNTTNCTTVQNWVIANSLSLYTPLDSGAAQVAYYGGFGMPTVVLLGGKNHRVMFSNVGFSTSDTTTMRDSIVALLAGKVTGINNMSSSITSFNVYPNPASDVVNINLNMTENAILTIDVLDITGKKVMVVMNEKAYSGVISKQFSTASLPNGNYIVQVTANGNVTSEKICVTH
jgi:hypothetical protein